MNVFFMLDFLHACILYNTAVSVNGHCYIHLVLSWVVRYEWCLPAWLYTCILYNTTMSVNGDWYIFQLVVHRLRYLLHWLGHRLLHPLYCPVEEGSQGDLRKQTRTLLNREM